MSDERVHLESATSFVELQLRGTRLQHAFGPLGGPPRVRIEAPVEPERLADRVRKLERKGYRVGFHHAELEAAIVADPSDPARRLVFADWLLERRDPRGELITRMAAGVGIEEHLAAFPLHLAPPWMASLELEWHLGFVRTLAFREHFDVSLLSRIFRHPSFMVLEELALCDLQWVRAPALRQVLQHRPSSLGRIDARGIPALAELAQEIPGFLA